MREPAPSPRDPYNPSDPRRQRMAEPPRWPIVPGGAGHTTPLPAHLTPVAPVATIAPVAPTAPARRRRRSLVGDVAAGLFLGDFARDLGLPGAITQITVSFVPLIGSTCALRDLVADLRHHDRVGAALNVLALTPILGGFSKTFEVIRSTAHVGHAMHISHQQAERRKDKAAG